MANDILLTSIATQIQAGKKSIDAIITPVALRSVKQQIIDKMTDLNIKKLFDSNNFEYNSKANDFLEVFIRDSLGVFKNPVTLEPIKLDKDFLKNFPSYYIAGMARLTDNCLKDIGQGTDSPLNVLLYREEAALRNFYLVDAGMKLFESIPSENPMLRLASGQARPDQLQAELKTLQTKLSDDMGAKTVKHPEKQGAHIQFLKVLEEQLVELEKVSTKTEKSEVALIDTIDDVKKTLNEAIKFIVANKKDQKALFEKLDEVKDSALKKSESASVKANPPAQGWFKNLIEKIIRVFKTVPLEEKLLVTTYKKIAKAEKTMRGKKPDSEGGTGLTPKSSSKK